ncbi:phosphate acyltransferase PlsX [Myxococcota bacterium]|nr:phosphate acyltransferase PlsX [Myxococcota bacterium]
MDSPPRVTIALDAMGSDHGPGEVVKAAATLSLSRPDLTLVLVGDEPLLTHLLSQDRYDPGQIAIRHAEGFVSMDESPGAALEARPRASILEAASLVASGAADALVTAGPTGAAVLAAARRLGRIRGVRRAALAAVYPTEALHGPVGDPFALLLDVGATTSCDARDLVTFAALGSAYARAVSGNPSPRVALLSNGAEPTKGPDEVVDAHRLLRSADIVDFAGNVEGLDIPKGTVDVVVTSGFVGNVVLKMLEGVAELAADLARDASGRKFLWRMGLTMLGSGLRQLQEMTDWSQYGGAPILGFERPVIKAHGRSRARAVANACKVAAKVARADLPREVERALGRVGEVPVPPRGGPRP